MSWQSPNRSHPKYVTVLNASAISGMLAAIGASAAPISSAALRNPALLPCIHRAYVTKCRLWMKYPWYPLCTCDVDRYSWSNEDARSFSVAAVS